VRLPAALAAALVAVAACARDGKSGGDSASTATATPTPVARADSASAPSTASAGAPTAATCVSEGKWEACSVEKRLTDAGFVPIRKGEAPTGVFDVPGTTYTLGAAELNVYLFPSAKEREAAIGAIDTVTVVRGAGASPWSSAPTLITSNNLVAVLLSDNGRLIERVQNAITAGLPSAAR
jgi:hypothetical protein